MTHFDPLGATQAELPVMRVGAPRPSVIHEDAIGAVVQEALAAPLSPSIVPASTHFKRVVELPAHLTQIQCDNGALRLGIGGSRNQQLVMDFSYLVNGEERRLSIKDLTSQCVAQINENCAKPLSQFLNDAQLLKELFQERVDPKTSISELDLGKMKFRVLTQGRTEEFEFEELDFMHWEKAHKIAYAVLNSFRSMDTVAAFEVEKQAVDHPASAVVLSKLKEADSSIAKIKDPNEKFDQKTILDAFDFIKDCQYLRFTLLNFATADKKLADYNLGALTSIVNLQQLYLEDYVKCSQQLVGATEQLNQILGLLEECKQATAEMTKARDIQIQSPEAQLRKSAIELRGQFNKLQTAFNDLNKKIKGQKEDLDLCKQEITDVTRTLSERTTELDQKLSVISDERATYQEQVEELKTVDHVLQDKNSAFGVITDNNFAVELMTSMQRDRDYLLELQTIHKTLQTQLSESSKAVSGLLKEFEALGVDIKDREMKLNRFNLRANLAT